MSNISGLLFSLVVSAAMLLYCLPDGTMLRKYNKKKNQRTQYDQKRYNTKQYHTFIY